MIFEFKNKKIVIFAIVILLVLLAGGLFWWWNSPDSKLKRWWVEEIIIKGSVRDFSIEDTPEGKIIQNKKEGFKVVVPAGWMVKKEYENIALYSPEVKFDERGALIFESIKKGGCGMNIQIKKYNKENNEISVDIEHLNMVIEGVKRGFYVEEKEPKYEIVSIDGKEGLKNTYIEENKIKYVTLEIPSDNTIYSFNSGFIFSEKCIDEFNKILETVEIK